MKRLTEKTIQEIIKLYQNGIPPKEIGEKFGIMNNSVTRILKKRGIERDQAAAKVDEETAQYIIEAYTDGISSEELAKELEIDGSTVCRVLKRNNIEIRPAIENKRIYPLNTKWLDEIDTEEKAYFLGLMWADGNVSKKRGAITIRLNPIDKDVLEKLSNIFYSCNRIKFYEEKSKDGRIIKTAVLALYSQYLKNRLLELGCMPNKTFIIAFPKWLNVNLVPHFIRGLMDGDGHISTKRTLIDLTGNDAVVLPIIDLLSENFDITTNKYKRHPERNNTNQSFTIRNYEDVKSFLDWIYQDATIYLERKYLAYQNFLERYKKYGESRYNEEEIAEILDLYQNGENMSKIGKILEINSGTIFKIIKREQNKKDSD